MAVVSTNLNIKNSCEHIISSVRESQLNYSMQETPYSLYLTVRKTFARSSTAFGQNLLRSPLNIPQENSELESLKVKLKLAESSNENLRAKYVDAVDDSELCHAKLSELEAVIKKLNDNESENTSTDFKRTQSEILKKDEVIKTLRSEKVNLEEALDVAEKNWKELSKLSKVKDKEVHDLKKENERINYNLENVSSELKNLSSLVNREKKS